MIALIAIVYFASAFALFKLGVIKKGVKAYGVIGTGFVVFIGFLIVCMNVYTPQSKDVRVYRYTVPIVSGVSGRVVEVSAEPNVPVAKGDVLFRVDPVPYQARVDSFRAQLAEAEQSARMLRPAYDSAQARVQRAEAVLTESSQQTAQLDESLESARAAEDRARSEAALALSNYNDAAGLLNEKVISQKDFDSRKTELDAANAAVDQAVAAHETARLSVDSILNNENTLVIKAMADLQAARADEDRALLALESQLDGVNTTVARLRADLDAAMYDLGESVIYAPADGYVTNLHLREGSVVGSNAMSSVVTFVEEADPVVIALLRQNSLRHVREGDPVDLVMDRQPGKVIQGEIESIIKMIAQGQLTASGVFPEMQENQPAGRFLLRIKVDPEDVAQYELPAGSAGVCGIYTSKGKPIHIIRKVTMRMATWMNYFFGP